MTDSKEIKATGWNFDNSYTRLPKLFFSNVNPIPVRLPNLVVFNSSLARSLGLENISVDMFAGNEIPKDSFPIAQAYAGHQFGHFTKLGDGRAILIGEHITPLGKRLDIQLKGSGRTPYSRGGDGRATLGPMLREYIISEAMYFLGIPTTRSLAVVTTGEVVERGRELQGAILTRVADSHLRVGTFQFAAKWGKIEDLKILADYTINRHFPDVEPTSPKRYLTLLDSCLKRQAKLIAQWQLIGFIHGVMNTDNMTISGETIDYGPCAFMDTYDPKTVFSSIDIHGRYAYGNQPEIGGWNVARFAESLLPLFHENEEKAVELAQEVVSSFTNYFNHYWLNGMRGKLGLFNQEIEDETLVKNLLNLMHKYKCDYTNTFYALTINEYKDNIIFETKEWTEWYNVWQARLHRQKESINSAKKLMMQSNPAVIPRNHLVEEALEAAVDDGDLSVLERLLAILSKPYEHSKKIQSLPIPSDMPYRTYCGT